MRSAINRFWPTLILARGEILSAKGPVSLPRRPSRPGPRWPHPSNAGRTTVAPTTRNSRNKLGRNCPADGSNTASDRQAEDAVQLQVNGRTPAQSARSRSAGGISTNSPASASRGSRLVTGIFATRAATMSLTAYQSTVRLGPAHRRWHHGAGPSPFAAVRTLRTARRPAPPPYPPPCRGSGSHPRIACRCAP